MVADMTYNIPYIISNIAGDNYIMPLLYRKNLQCYYSLAWPDWGTRGIDIKGMAMIKDVTLNCIRLGLDLWRFRYTSVELSVGIKIRLKPFIRYTHPGGPL